MVHDFHLTFKCFQKLGEGEDIPPAYKESIHQQKDCTSRNPWGKKNINKETKSIRQAEKPNQPHPVSQHLLQTLAFELTLSSVCSPFVAVVAVS